MKTAPVASILYIEDDRPSAKLIQRIFAKEFSYLQLIIVSNGESARNALIGEEYLEWDPNSDISVKHKKTTFKAAIWDNQFPDREGSPPSVDMGLNLARELALSNKVSETVLSHFAMSSADEGQQKFQSCGLFSYVLPKPVNLQTLREMIRKWGLAEEEKS
ncbi:MAG TPA: hypothetical protein VLE89_02395 [Chlamydiales bacterium]|nr:hypothetical protein [Chlamydiales bacterium]